MECGKLRWKMIDVEGQQEVVKGVMVMETKAVEMNVANQRDVSIRE